MSTTTDQGAKPVLVELHTRCVPRTSTNSDATRQYIEDNELSENAARVISNLFPNEPLLRLILDKLAEARTVFGPPNTFGWRRGSARLCLPAKVPILLQRIAEIAAEVDDLAARFAEDYPNVLRRAANALNGDYRPEKYPPVDVVRDAFKVEMSLPYQDSDYVKNLFHELDEAMQARVADMAERTERDIQDAVRRETLRTLLGPITAVLEKLQDIEANPSHRVSQAMLDKLAAAADTVREWNPGGDPVLAKFEQVARRIAHFPRAALSAPDTDRGAIIAQVSTFAEALRNAEEAV